MRLLMLLIALCVAPCAHAQKLYRCGNQYQDRPCDAGQGKQISSAANGAAKLPPPFVDLSCAKRGEAAEEIAKRLAQGVSSEQLLHEIDKKYATADSKLAEKRLVVDVAQHKGSAAEIRVLTESDCVLARSAKPVPSSPGTPYPPSVSQQGANEIAMQRQQKERAAAEKQTKCERYARDMTDIRSAERRGGSAKHMDQLNEEYRLLETQRQSAGC